MKKDNLKEFKELLLNHKTKILNSGVLRSGEDLVVSSDDLADETDLATAVINQQVSFNIRHRELNKLRLIEEALERIEDGSYGLCDDCGESIGAARLKNQPWATLCIIHAEERERENQRFARHG